MSWTFEVFLCFAANFVVSLVYLADYFFEKMKFHSRHHKPMKRL